MKRISFFALMVFLSASVTLTSCRKNDVDDEEITPTTPQEISGDVTASKTYPQGTYILKGFVYVKNNATLTFEAGSVIRGDKDSKGTLIVTRGSKLVANGTATNPIVFTSGKEAGSRNPGDWGGIIILGKAPINIAGGEGVIEGGVDNAAGDGKYGGTDANDNSGSLKYVRIEYGGIAFVQNNEINTLTLGGVGRGTILENVQVSYGGDDGIEFFGGTVNAKNIISLGHVDDDFDFDNGYQGNIQFAVALRDPGLADAAGDSNGIESDNDANGSTNGPITRPVISNMTLVGPNGKPGEGNVNAKQNAGNRWRRSARPVLRNSVIMGYANGALLIESEATAAAIKGNTDASIRNNIFTAVQNTFRLGSGITSFADAAALSADLLLKGNVALATAADVMLENPFSLNAPNLMPKAGSPALTGASFDGDLANSFFTQVAYKGAFGGSNWTTGWANFNPQTATY
jgi:hypothetical protein